MEVWSTSDEVEPQSKQILARASNLNSRPEGPVVGPVRSSLLPPNTPVVLGAGDNPVGTNMV